MTLIETVRAIEKEAMRQPAVRMIVRHDVYRINNVPDRRYGILVWTQQEHSATISNDIARFRFSLFYVDRLTENRRNELEVQSTGIQVLDNIIRGLYEKGICAEDWTYRAFTERFVDECAGVWCDVSFSVPVSMVCVDTSPDFSGLDDNNGFLIF